MNLIQSIVAYFLILNTIGSALLVPLIYLDFNLRRDYIAEVLCIEREQPITVCGGKCYLDFKLEEAGGLEQEAPAPNRQLEISFFRQENLKMSFHSVTFNGKKTYPLFGETSAYNAFIGDVFHPPKFS